MSELPPLKSGLYLRTALKLEGVTAAEGKYTPSRNQRIVTPGKGYASHVARMVSFHEGFHAILNGSTTFGNAMVFAGALHEAGEDGFEGLIEAMISDAVTTHETYATLSAIYATVGGGFDRSLIEAYPDYVPLYDAVACELDLESRPYIASVCIESMARVAMQTTLLATWASLQPERWIETDWPVDQTPDVRFKKLLNRRTIDGAVEAIERVMAQSHEPFAALIQTGHSPEEMTQCVRATSTAAQDLVSATAFRVFAAALARHGIPAAEFDSQRGLAQQVARIVTDFAGGRLKTEFYVPDDLEADRHAVILDFRRERMDLRPQGQPAAIAWLEDIEAETALSFADHGEDGRYVQLVAMPLEKALHNYSFHVGQHVLAGGSQLITGVRRRLAPADDRPAGLVEIIRLREPSDLDFWKKAGDDVRGVICASVLYGGNWMSSWLSREASRLSSLAVLVDVDPFYLLPHLARGTTLMISRATVRMDEPGVTEKVNVLIFVAADRPDVVHFTPCSGPVFDAVIDFLAREFPDAQIGFDLTENQMDVFATAVSHALREEPVFGFDFW